MQKPATRTAACVFLATFIATLAASCGGGSSSLFRSGSRLRARILSAGDATVFVTWHDKELGADCSFMTAGDGKLRCLPAFPQELVSSSDSDCSRPILQDFGDFPSPPKSIIGPVGQAGCDAIAEHVVFDVGGKLNIAFPFEGRPGSCNAQTLRQDQPSFELTEVAPEKFVEATVKREPFSDGLEVSRLVAADGSEQVIGLFDLAHETACTAGVSSDQAKRCVPIELVDAGLIPRRSPSCPGVAWVAAAVPAGCANPRVAFEPKQTADCPATFAYFEIASSPPEPEAAKCGSIRKGTETFRIGAEIPVSAFPPLATQLEGDGRLRIRAFAGADALGPSLGFFDTQSGTPCVAFDVCGDTKRCLPPSAAEVTDFFFADAACTRPVALSSRCDGADEPKIVTNVSGCALLRKLGREITTLFERDNGVCNVSAFSNARVFEVGDPLDATEFARVDAALE